MSLAPPEGAPRVAVEEIVEWPDTDASGHHHHSAIGRWVEAAEAELLEELGLLELFGGMPRVRYEVDYRARLWFRDRVTIELWVADVGTASVRYRFVVRRGADVAAEGAMTVVHIDLQRGRATSWPSAVRERLTVGFQQL